MERHALKLTFASLLLTLTTFAQNRAGVRLRAGEQVVPTLTDELVDSFNRHLPRTAGRAYLMLQFDRVPDAADRKLLSGAGVELEQYLNDGAYSAVATGPLSRTALRSGGVRGAWAFTAAQKMDPSIRDGKLPVWALRSGGQLKVLVRVPSGIPFGTALATLTGAGFSVTTLEWRTWNVIGLLVPAGRLQELAGFSCVDFVQAEPPRAEPLNFYSRQGSRANVLNGSLALGGYNLNGSGIVMGVGDDGDPQSHVDFTGRVTSHASGNYSNHGVHVAGTMAGAGIKDERYRGYASKAGLVVQTSSLILSNAARYHTDYGMTLTNNSYGNIIACDYHGTYDIYAQLIDEQAFDIPDLLHVFAAGNSGNSTCSPFAQRFHTVLGGWQSAKNVVSVGATSDSGLVASFSSRGPVRDGRVKPEITATGVAVFSTTYDVGGSVYNTNQGTSMAAPAVTGGLALLAEKYKALHGGTNAKGALLKAVLCNGASDRGTTGPDFNYGYGWMNLLRSVDMLEKGRVISGNATQVATNTHSIAVPANTAQLKVLLYWHDPAASLLAAKTLVNDLDLEVVDLSNGTVLPYRLDTSSASLGTAAFTAADHINNMEQVVIDAPAAGNYSIRVKGYAINENGSQDYFVAWDAVPVSLQLVNPVTSQAETPGDVVKIQWEAYGNSSSTYTLEYSTNGGSSWNTIDTDIAPDRRYYSWTVPSVPTGTARVRVTQSGTNATSTSGDFVILERPVLSFALNAEQCDGYMVISWTGVPGATDYELCLMRGGEMQGVATTTSTTYTFQGLNRDSVYWVAVRPRINGAAGRRSLATGYQPNKGNCVGTIGDNDLKLMAIYAPLTGRQLTSTALTASTPVTVLVRNLDDAATSAGFQVQYSADSSAYVTQSVSATLPAVTGAYVHTFGTTADLSAVGTHTITAVVKHNTTDTRTFNDTLVRVLRQLPNAALTLPHTDSLEGLTQAVYLKDTTGLYGDVRFDYQHSSSWARLRTAAGTGFTKSGSRSITLDQNVGDSIFNATAGGSQFVVATYNLSGYDTASSDLRFAFNYLIHGISSHADNKLWIRGNDGAAWLEAFDLANLTASGKWEQTGSLELTRLLKAGHQNFSSSFQVKWGQNGSLPATEPGYYSGYSFDDIQLYAAQKDVQVLAIQEPAGNACALTNATPVTVTVRNSSMSNLTSIPVQYRIDSGSWVSETVAALAAGIETDYTFNATANLSGFGSHLIEARVTQSGDNVPANDSVSASVVNSPIITSFPYLEGFETSSGNWFTAGTNSSWQWGTPASQALVRAATGSKVWKTGLSGNYKDREFSYLYSPCFNLQGMTAPTLSMALVIDFEDCTPSVCDAAWMEYSNDGVTWTKLGANGQGTNWYNRGSGINVWSRTSFLTWRVASIPLPTTNNDRIRLRLVVYADESVSRQGVAIDNVHIYDNTSVFTGPTGTSVTQSVSGNSWVHVKRPDGKLLASIHPNGQNLGSTEVQAYVDTSSVKCTSYQYYLGRNYTIKPANRSLGDSVTVRLYFTEREVEQVLNANSCGSASKPSTAFDFGVSKFNHPDASLEDNSLDNDSATGSWYFYRGGGRSIVPYDGGYYAEFKVKDFSEFWFNSGGPNNSSPLPVRFTDFTARRAGDDAALRWVVATEEEVDSYDVEVADGEADQQSGRFVRLGNVPALGNTSNGHTYSFVDRRSGKSGTQYYRIRVRNRNGSFQFSAQRPVQFTAHYRWFVSPNPSSGRFYLNFQGVAGESVQLRMLDGQGRELRRWTRSASGFVEKIAVDVDAALPAGIYLLQVESGGRQESFRLFRN